MDYTSAWTAALAEGKLIPDTDSLYRLVRDAATTTRIQTVNVHHLHLAGKLPGFAEVLRSADHVTADGWPLVLSARKLAPRCERVTGKGLCRDLAMHPSLAGLRMAVLGSTAAAHERLQHAVKHNDVTLVYGAVGDAAQWDLAEVTRKVVRAQADLVLLALGAVLGEPTAAALRAALPRGVVISVGGGVDMAAGLMPAAPRGVERLHAEWLYRLAREPRRLGRRYIIECPPAAAALLYRARR